MTREHWWVQGCIETLKATQWWVPFRVMRALTPRHNTKMEFWRVMENNETALPECEDANDLA